MKSIVKILIFLIGIMASSCTTTKFYYQKFPILPIPNRPIISEELNQKDFENLMRYSQKLEISIVEYNKFAKDLNVKIDEYYINLQKEKNNETKSNKKEQ